jgi:hypothetical protein
MVRGDYCWPKRVSRETHKKLLTNLEPATFLFCWRQS